MTKELGGEGSAAPSPTPSGGGGGGATLKQRKRKTLVVKRQSTTDGPGSRPASEAASIVSASIPSRGQSRVTNRSATSAGSMRIESRGGSAVPAKKKSRTVVVARAIKPGGTIRLTDKDGAPVTATLPALDESDVASDDEEYTGLPRSLAEGGGVAPRPRRTKAGHVVRHDVLGDPDEYDTMVRASEVGTPLSAAEQGHAVGGMETETSFSVHAGDEDGEILAEQYDDEYDQEGGDGGKVTSFVPGLRTSSIQQATPDAHRTGTSGGARSTRIEELTEDELAAVKSRLADSRAAAAKSRQSHLRQLSVHDRTDALREERALARWEAANREWDSFTNKLAKKLGRAPEDMVFSRGQDFREHQENLDAMYRAMPEDQKNGGDSWLMQLRGGGGAKYVRIGNAVTGLYVPVKESTREMEIIRKPRPNLGKYGKKERRRDGWKSSDYIQKRQQDVEKKRIADGDALHDPDYDSLIVLGEGIEPKIVLPYEIVPDDPITFTPFVPVNDEQATTGEGGGDGRRTASVIGMVSDGVEGQSVIPRFEGPSLRFDSDRMSFWADCPDKHASTVKAFNNGSTALFYRWKKKDGISKLQVPREQSLDQAERFFLSNNEGVIVPGDTVDFSFIFQSGTAGNFQEVWELETRPPLAAPTLMTLHGVSFDRDDCGVDRDDVDIELARLESVHTSEWVLGDILRDVRTPTPPPRPVIPMTDLGNKFEFHNRQFNIYYHEEEVDAMNELYNRVRPLAVVQEQARREAAAAAASKGKKGGDKKKGGGKKKDADNDADDKNDEEEAEKIPQFPEIWDGNVESLHNLILWMDEGSEERHNALKEAATLLEACATPWPWDDQDLVGETIARDMVTDLVMKIAGASMRNRDDLDLPPLPMQYPAEPATMPVRPASEEGGAEQGGKKRAGGNGSDAGSEDEGVSENTRAAQNATPVREYPAGMLRAQVVREKERWSMERQAAEDEYSQQMADEALSAFGEMVERFALIRGSEVDTEHYITENGLQVRSQPLRQPAQDVDGVAEGVEGGSDDGHDDAAVVEGPVYEPRVPWDWKAEKTAEFVVEDPKAKGKGAKGGKKGKK